MSADFGQLAAVLERGRARSVAERAEASRLGASAELRRVLALPSDSIPRTEALPSTPTLGSPEFARLAVFARERRPDLVAAEADLLGARRGMTVARLGLVPNLRVSALGGEEGGSDHLRGIGIGLTIPLFYRGEAERGVAAADLATAEAVAVDVARRIDAELAASLAAYVRAHSAERRFTTEVLASASANVALTERALAEGEVGLTEVLLLRGTALGAQLEYLDVLTNNYEAWFELAAALGVEPSELPGLLGVPEN